MKRISPPYTLFQSQTITDKVNNWSGIGCELEVNVKYA